MSKKPPATKPPSAREPKRPREQQDAVYVYFVPRPLDFDYPSVAPAKNIKSRTTIKDIDRERS